MAWWPFAVALQGEAANHREVRRSRVAGTTVLTPAGRRARPASAASQRQRPCTPPAALHLAGLHITRHQRRFKQFTRPVFPSPTAARVERAAASAFPRASHPADQEPDNARRGGDRPTEHGPGTRSTTSVDLRSSTFAHSVRPRRRNTCCESWWLVGFFRVRLPPALNGAIA